MEVRIGIRDNAGALSFESSLSPKDLTSTISQAIKSGEPLVELSDDKGKTILVPTNSIAFVEIGAEAGRRVGFIA